MGCAGAPTAPLATPSYGYLINTSVWCIPNPYTKVSSSQAQNLESKTRNIASSYSAKFIPTSRNARTSRVTSEKKERQVESRQRDRQNRF